MPARILIVEDDPSALIFAQYTLEQEGYQVLTAANGLEGLRKAREEERDLVVLDVMLPGLDGFQLCRRLRSETLTAKLPILMLSAKARESDRGTGLKLGADEYLTKPASPAQLVAGVTRLLAQRGVVPSRGGRDISGYLTFAPPDKQQGSSSD